MLNKIPIGDNNKLDKLSHDSFYATFVFLCTT